MDTRTIELSAAEISEVVVAMRFAANRWAVLADSSTSKLTVGASEVYAKFAARCSYLAELFADVSSVSVNVTAKARGPKPTPASWYDYTTRQWREDEPPF